MKLRALLLFLTLGGLGTQSAHADSRDRWERKQERRERTEDRLTNRLIPQAPETGRLSSDEASRIAQQRNGGGRVLGVSPAIDGWRVRLVKDGEVRTVFVPDTP